LDFKKKTHTLNPKKEKEKQEIEIQQTKQEKAKVKVNDRGVERSFRDSLVKKISGTIVGIWLLAGEHLRLGNWDLIKGFTGGTDTDIEPRIAMQIVNEAAICNNRVRRSNYITHQGFEQVNGLGFLVTDTQVHDLLDKHTVAEARSLQESLAMIRSNMGHYPGELIAIDPHRIVSTTQRIMPEKKKRPQYPSEKMLQTFFALDTQSGQPIGCGIGSSGANTSQATMDLLGMAGLVNPTALILADKEHFTESLIRGIDQNTNFEFLVPAISTDRIQKIERDQSYQHAWAGYAVAETVFNFDKKKEKYRLLCQREGETENNYAYKSFLTLSGKPAIELLTENYGERWSIEDFFNFDGAMGFDRASTFNLNIRYGKMSLALLAQAATFELRKKLPKPYNRWNSTHLAEAVFTKMDGDIRVIDDTIIVTCYNVPKELNLHNHYQDLPQRLIAEGIDPRIPWLYNYKLDFRFK